MPRDCADLFVALRIILHTWRDLRLRAQYVKPLTYQGFNCFQHLRPHGPLPWQYKHTVLHAAGQAKLSILHGSLLEHFGVYIVETVAARQRGIRLAGHLRGILANEIGHISHILSLLQHHVAATEIVSEKVHLGEPGVLAVELIAKPGADARERSFIGLLDIYVEKRRIYALAEETVSTLLHHIWITVEYGSARRTAFCPHLLLAINMCTTACCAVLDVAQRAFTPELAGHLVALSTVHQELAGEAPVTVAFQPRGKSVLIANLSQSPHIVICHAVGNEPAQIPQEAFALILGAHYLSEHYRDPWHRIIAICFLEGRNHVVRPVLSAHLITVFHHHDK